MNNFKCSKCGKVFSTIQGFALHRLRKHKGDKTIKAVKTKAKAQPKVNTPTGESKRKYTKRAAVLETGMQYISIPVVLRIPITIGKAQFIEIGE